MDERGRHLVYSVTKTFLGVLCLRLDLDLEAPVATWIDDERLPRATLRQLLNHTSGIPDYGRLPEYAAAVRDTPSEPWRRRGAARPVARRRPRLRAGRGLGVLEHGLPARAADRRHHGGRMDFAGALERELLRPARPLGHVARARARRPRCRWFPAGATRSAMDAGTSVAATTRAGSDTARSSRRVPTNAASGARSPAGELCDLARLTESVEIGFDAPGFVRPSYGIGLMTDPGWEDGLLIGHGGGGPGYAAACFALVRERSRPARRHRAQRRRAGRCPGGGAGRAAQRRYPRLNTLRTGALVRPDVSRTAIVTVYRPLPRKRWAGTQLRV